MYQVLLFKFRRHLCKGSMKGRELNYHIWLIPKVITLKLFIDMVISLSLHNLTTCVEQIFSWSMRLIVKRSGLSVKLTPQDWVLLYRLY